MRALVDCGYHLAYRVLDAQYASPQRRRRLFLSEILQTQDVPQQFMSQKARHTSTLKGVAETPEQLHNIGGGSQPHGVVAPRLPLPDSTHAQGYQHDGRRRQHPSLHSIRCKTIPSSDGKTHAITSGSPVGVHCRLSYALRTAQTGSVGVAYRQEDRTLDGATPEAVHTQKQRDIV